MPLATTQDIALLTGWNLLSAYVNNKAALVAVGNAVYQALNTYVSPLVANDVERPLIAALLTNTVFRGICFSKQHARPSLHPAFAGALARYMLDTEWTAITRS